MVAYSASNIVGDGIQVWREAIGVIDLCLWLLLFVAGSDE